MNQPTIHRDVEQGSDAWHDLKCGKGSASKMAVMTAGGKGTTRNNYVAKVACERLTGKPIIEPSFGSMNRGTEEEGDGRSIYEFDHGVTVEEVAFIDHATIPNFGCSPDGLVDDDGMIEIKTRIPTVQIEFIRSKKIPTECMKQILAQLEVSGRAWCDYVSYCPEMPEHLRLLVQRVERNEIELVPIREAVKTFLADVDSLVAELTEMKGS